MKQRLLTGWNFRRIMYAAIGIALIVQSIMIKEWFGILVGGYFAAMGIFAFGCAGGNCFGGNCTTPIQKYPSSTSSEIEHEAIKTS
ncbi:MAG: hypothetical protein KF781_05930 [Chitinophagaceae bacterium]|nr:hypothetical protein [Chitinophagaceae bacterium]MCW5906065.1 hypothetical protein [Chitinophagaceae bacterium]